MSCAGRGVRAWRGPLAGPLGGLLPRTPSPCLQELRGPTTLEGWSTQGHPHSDTNFKFWGFQNHPQLQYLSKRTHRTQKSVILTVRIYDS